LHQIRGAFHFAKGSDDGADTATSIPMPAIAAFCTSSNEAREDVSKARPEMGSS
jgi:hypothetical protein